MTTEYLKEMLCKCNEQISLNCSECTLCGVVTIAIAHGIYGGTTSSHRTSKTVAIHNTLPALLGVQTEVY